MNRDERRSAYVEKLRDPRWQKKRLEVLNRDDFTCRHCGAKDKTLHIHHGFYMDGKEPWQYPTDSLTTLCLDCHEAETAALRVEQWALINRLRYLGFGSHDFTLLRWVVDQFASHVGGIEMDGIRRLLTMGRDLRWYRVLMNVLDEEEKRNKVSEPSS